MSYLEIEGLTKKFGEATAVSGLTLSVERGQFVSLLGPSGCGKTTTLQMIVGFVVPDSGRIVLDGNDLSRVHPSRRGIGIVFQNYALFPHMTVAKNVAFGLEMRSLPAAEIASRVERVLDMVHLKGLENRLPRQLSGGQQQRVALARALIIEPSLLLLDEPFSNLDAQLREDMRIELRALQRKLGITTVLVTHDQSEAFALSDVVAIMEMGSIMQTATPHAAYEHPSNVRVSQFLGKTNLLRGEVVRSADREITIELNGGIQIQALREMPEGSILMSIRPERIRLVPADGGILNGRIVARIFQGHLWIYDIETKAGRIFVCLANDGGSMHEEGAVLGIDWDPDTVHMFPETRLA